ncbi:MAG: phosphocholine cytidylyltransferase family protein [Gammaproteobacteria bacterium]|nr:phosphocholine cytidylyltransferase family protein [Gammaproteobacteria bacterium]
MIQTAVILAAGMGTRLRGEVQDYPKGFLKLGAKPIIEESIERLVRAGIRDIVIVTGHCAKHYEQLAAEQDGLVRTIHNPQFADSGSMYSLYCAREVLDGDFLLLESDLIFEQRALTELLAMPDPDAILLSGPTAAGDEVWVETLDGHLVNMSKDPAALAGVVAGELVGISKISKPLFALMQGIAEQAFKTSLRFDYETDCLVAAATLRPIKCPVVSNLVWSEIDDPSHLQRAREQIYPRLQQSA